MITKNNNYDALVIGAGIGGLTIGCLLSFTKKVLILEKNITLGGYCSTFKRNDFIFEAAIHAINNCKENHFAYDILKRCDVIDKIEFLKPKSLYRAIYPNHDFIVAQENVNSYLNMLIKYFPKESNGIKELFKNMHNVFSEVEKINKCKSLKKSPNLIQASKESLEKMMDRYLDSSELKAIISQHWMYCGLPPSKLSPIHFSYISQDYLLNGGYCIKGGTQKLVDCLAKKIKDNGSEILPRHEVDAVIVKDSVAKGVKTTTGECFWSDYIISNIDARRTYESITEKNQVVDICLRQMDKTRPSISTVRVYLGLGVDLKKLGINDYEVFVNPSYNLDLSYDSLMKNRLDNVPFGICIHSNVDHTICGEGKSIVSITMLSGYDYWKVLPKYEYKKKKLEVAEKLIQKTEEAVIPNLGKYINVKVVATPLTMERYTGNGKGAAYGWTRNVNFYGSKHMNIQTPIKNLFLSSNWTKIGGGVEGVLRSADRTYDLIVN